MIKIYKNENDFQYVFAFDRWRHAEPLFIFHPINGSASLVVMDEDHPDRLFGMKIAERKVSGR